MPASGWTIGFAHRRITPPLGSQMAGFDARKLPSESVHDDLHARAMVFGDGRTTVVFVSVELIAVSADFSAAVRMQVESVTGIPAANVFLSATHTHCGPVTLHHFFNQGQPLDAAYLQSLAQGIEDAVVDAFAARRVRTLKSGMVPVSGIAVNRRTEDGLPVDPFAGVLLVEELDGAPAVIAVFYACHTTVLGPDTLSITQDFPFYTLGKLKDSLGAEVEAMYFNGAEGDLSIGHKSELSAVGIVDSFRTFTTAKRLGEALADAVLAGLPSLEEERPVVEVMTRRVDLPLKSYAPLDEMTRAREEALGAIVPGDVTPAMLVKRQRALFARIEEYYQRLYEAAPTGKPKTLAVEMSAVRLGETVVLTLPGEVFVRHALAIRGASPYAKTLFLGLTNDYIGYVPDEQATAASGYEVVASRVPAAAGKLLQAAAAHMLASFECGKESGV